MLGNENGQDAAAAQEGAEIRLEQRLKESETLLGAIVATARQGILVADAETGRLVMTNPAMCRLTGYGEAELMAMRAAELHPPEVRQPVLCRRQHRSARPDRLLGLGSRHRHPAIERELARYRDDLQALVEERTAKLAVESRRNATIIDLALDGYFRGSLDGRITGPP